VSKANERIADPAARKHRVRLRRIGALTLTLGLAAAGIVYWHGTRSEDFSGDPSMAGFDRARAHQMGVMYGKSGQMVDDLVDALKRSEVQAGLIAAVSGLFALGCFYLGSSRRPEVIEDSTSQTEDSG